MTRQAAKLSQSAVAPQEATSSKGLADVPLKSLSLLSDSIAENVNVWLNVLDDQLNIVLWNRVAETISGFSQEDVVGNNLIWSWLYPDEEYRQRIMARTACLFEKDTGLEYFETRIRCKNGEIKIISWNSCSLVNEIGRIYGIITFGYDITDRKQTEEALRKANREISALYHVASVASASLDLDTILERSLDCVLGTMNTDKGLIHLWDEGDEKLYLVAQKGLSSDIIAKIDEVLPEKGLTGWVFSNSRPLLTHNPTTDPATPSPIFSGLNNAYLGVPMNVKGKTVGVFGVLGESGRKFQEDEVALLASIADQVSVAVENARLYQQAEQIAVMEERERLAYDLHDSVTQSLYSLTLLAEAARRLTRSGELDRAGDYITRLGETAQDALKEMRLLVYKLRPPALEREGLVGAIQQRLGAVERRAGIKAHLIANDTTRLSPPIEEGLYRIAQEALNNALKHAKANSVIVRINIVKEQVELIVEDNGIGFDPDTIDRSEGMGVPSMKERVKRLGGTMHIHSAPGQGTSIIIRMKTCLD